MPNHVFNLPRPVKEFLSKAKLKATYIFSIVTYGSEIASTVDELLKLRQFDYVNILLMVDNYFPMFSLEQQLRDEPKKQTSEHMVAILKDIENRERYINRPGLMKRITGYVEQRVFPLLGQTVKRYSVTMTNVSNAVSAPKYARWTIFPTIPGPFTVKTASSATLAVRTALRMRYATKAKRMNFNTGIHMSP